MSQPTSDDIENMIDAAARGSMEKRAEVFEDAELREQISDPFYAKATMNVALADEGDSWTISKKDFNAYTLQLVEMTKARDAAKERELDHNKARRRMATILKSYGFTPVNDCINQLIAAATDAMRRESDQAKEEG